MAEGCAIPCNAGDLQASLRGKRFGDETFSRLPVIGVALALAVVSPALILVAPVVTAVVLGGWGLLGVAVLLGQSWLAAAAPARAAMPAELVRLVDTNAPRIHEPRVVTLRRRAAALSLDHPNFDTNVTRVLQELREATGEAWRCPCRKRRLPLPF